MNNRLETVYSNKLKVRQEENRLLDSAFMYDKEEFTNFVKVFYADRLYNEELGLIQMAKNLTTTVLQQPNLLLAFIFYSRQEEEGAFVNFYTQLAGNVIRLTDISITKNAIQYLDEEAAIDALDKL